MSNTEKKQSKFMTKLHAVTKDATNINSAAALVRSGKGFFIGLIRFAILFGVGYVILAPVIGMIAKSIMSDVDANNPMVYIIPEFPTLEKYKLVIERMNYWPTLGRDLAYTVTLMFVQIFVCSMVGYGFARFNFPFKNVLFGCVVVMIIIPTHTIMLPLYMTFRNFNPLGLMKLFAGGPKNLMGTVAPMYILTIFACGLRSGLYIYIFNQFFRGLPKEIEEAAFVDGAGVWYTYFRIMLINAMPAVITVAVFSLVWQYNDTFYANLFLISDKVVLSKKVSTLVATISNVDRIMSPKLQQLYVDAGVLLMIVPIIIVYLFLQKQFIEGVERSGIVG